MNHKDRVMKFRPLWNHLKFLFAAPALLCAAALFGASPASAQPVQDFLNTQGGSDLVNSNLGQSALAVQRTCLELIPLDPANAPDVRPPGSPGEQLFLRCGELVNTANQFNGSGSIVRTLGYTDANELLAAFQQVNGEEVQATSTMASNASNEQFSIVAARLGALRGATSASITSVAANGTEFMFGSGGGAAADDAGMAFGPWGWFIRGSYTSGERDPSNPASFTGQENGFDFDQSGLTVGIDHMSGAAVWGVAISYSNYEVTMKGASAPNSQTQVVDGGKIEADAINGSFYFDYNSQSDIYFSALTGFGTQSFDMARNFIYFRGPGATAANVTDQTRLLTAAPDGDSIAASLALGRIVQKGSMVIDPRIGFTFDRISIDQFSEVDSGNLAPAGGVGAMNLSFAEQKIDSMRANVGIQFSNNVNTSFGSIRPTFSADWFHEFEDDPRAINVKYALEDELANEGNFSTGFTNCVSCFSMTSEAPDSDYFVAGVGLAAAYRNGLQSFLMFESLLGYENLTAYSITVGLRGQF
jgi:uncharacterized protein YhjY with autotransporter beta-barrel domain